jgi:pimeloyl-ACP methyl ester carboxylesterase
MPTAAVYFSHGQESGPWGTKITAMAETVRALGLRAESVDYRGIAEPGRRVEKLVTECAGVEGPLVLAGSSMGGYVATAAAARLKPAGVFVLAPAFDLTAYGVPIPPPPVAPLEIVHGWRDDVVPPERSIAYAREIRATLHLVDGDHRLTENIDEINEYLARFIRRVLGLPGGEPR